MCDIYARPDEPITSYRTPWSGIRKRDMIRAIPVENACNIIRNIIRVTCTFYAWLNGAVDNRRDVFGLYITPCICVCTLLEETMIPLGAGETVFFTHKTGTWTSTINGPVCHLDYGPMTERLQAGIEDIFVLSRPIPLKCFTWVCCQA